MDVNDELVDKLAHLSRLKFSESEKTAIKDDLQRMIRFVDKLNELDLADTQPLLHMTEEVNVFREDEVKGSIERSEGLKNAPQHDDQFFIVPKVIRNTNQQQHP
jgi:aspartyl-tRNA(Asn)/glutamyl-tRNA(Gln) amidotransferase subunit C